MKTILLSELRKVEFSADKIISIFQYWNDGDVFNSLTQPKKNHALLYFAGCDGEYTLPNGESFIASRGDVIFIPEGARYKTAFFNKQDKVSTILINFGLETEGERFSLSEGITRLANDPNKVFNKLFYKSAREFASVNSSVISMKHYLYQILHELQKAHKSEIDPNADYAKIAKGISYLENDNDQTLSIEQLAETCGVSTNTFRRLFNSYAGASPIEFRLRQKILRAKQLLEAENFTVSEISDMLGFSDVSYFSRIFKKKTGQSPLEYIESRK